MTRIRWTGWRTLWLLGLLGAAVVLAAGCGCSSCDSAAPYWGNVYVDNTTDIYPPPMDMLTFQLAPVGLPFSGNLLYDYLPPGYQEFVGQWSEDYYDGFATLDDGVFTDTVEWWSVWVGGGGTFTFDILG